MHANDANWKHATPPDPIQSKIIHTYSQPSFAKYMFNSGVVTA